MIKHYEDLDDPRALVETAAEVLALYWHHRACAAEEALRWLAQADREPDLLVGTHAVATP